MNAHPLLLEIAGVKKHFGATVALDGVDLGMRSGEVHAIVGENGAGKSTLMNVLSGSIQPDAGAILFQGLPYRPSNPLAARRHAIAHIHQELSLCPHLSVAENIFLGGEPRRRGWLDHREMNDRAAEILKSFPHPAITPQRRVGDLTIAARQVVEICRALAQRASLILMDEPTSSLQRQDVDRLFRFIEQLRGSGISVIYISHFLEEVREIAGSFTVLRDGRSVLTGSLRDITNDQLIAAMVGRPMQDLFPACSGGATQDYALVVHNLNVPPVVRQASLELRRGEVLGIAGLVGSGRTRMIRALFGLEKAGGGNVTVFGKPLRLRGGPQNRMKHRVGYLSEDRKGEGLATSLSVADNITLPDFSSTRWGWIDLHRQKEVATDCAGRVGVRAQSMESTVQRLSGGNQQKVALARLLHQDCEVFLLDEPTRGVDVGSKAQIYELITSLARSGKAVLMVSSYLPELFGICDRLAVMSRGVLSPARPISEWTPETVLQAALGAPPTPDKESRN